MNGERITFNNEKLFVPKQPIIPYIEGDGIGIDIFPAMVNVVDAAVEMAYNGEKQIIWKEILAGEKAFNTTGQWLPQETLNCIREHVVAIKGPLTTPVGEGFRSINVTMRKELDLYCCMRKNNWIPGVPSPVKHPEKVDIVLFRENTEDVYSGIEWEAGSEHARQMITYIKNEMGYSIREDSGIGIKPMSETGSKRLIRKAIEYAVQKGRKSVTFVHKGNIMKYTEGAFKKWGYEVANEEFSEQTITEEALSGESNAKQENRIIIKDRIADSMFQQILLRSDEYDVLAMPNLNGDYFSDAIAAQIGGIGMAPGANIGKNVAVFEATHGTAPKYAGKDRANPCSLILSAVMMLEYMNWHEPAMLIQEALKTSIEEKRVTYDLARNIPEAIELSTSSFSKHLIIKMKQI